MAAEKLALILIEQRLAACVNLIPEMESIYFWDGKIVRERETKVIIKSTSAKRSEIIESIKKHHPYEMPEITVLGDKGHVTMDEKYWAWLTAYVTTSADDA